MNEHAKYYLRNGSRISFKRVIIKLVYIVNSLIHSYSTNKRFTLNISLQLPKQNNYGTD